MPAPCPCPLPPRSRSRLIARGLPLVLALGLWLALPGVASAHAHLALANPAPNSVLDQAPSVAQFIFDEPLNPALTRVHISDASGRPVTADTGHLAPGHGGALWLLPLPRLAAGTYSVFWTSESATDGHVMGSFYTFRIAPSGGTGAAGGVGAVSGAAGGAYGGGTTGAGGIGLTVGALGTALIHWIGLAAQALWLGCLLVEVLVLAPGRRRGAPPEARLAWAATRRLWRLAGAALVGAALALAGETLSLTLQGTDGDLGRALDPTILGGVLSSQNGHIVVARAAVLVVALLVAVLVRVPENSTTTAAAPLSVARAQRSPRAPRALGIVAQAPPALPRLPRLPWAWTLPVLVTLALADMLLTAFAGHASDVTPAALSYTVDWLHLVCTAAWAGGIAALAWGVMPLRRTLAPAERAPATLPLLDRFSPVAYAAVAILTLSGLYNAVNHLDAPQRLADTLYGQLLDVKVALVAVLFALSASHVYRLRPRIARLQRQSQRQSPSAPGRADTVATMESAAAGVHKGLAALAARLRLEGGVGAAILLATALMSQTLPQSSTTATAGTTTAATDTTPASITGTAVTGNLRGQLTVAPPAVGSATFTLTLSEGGTTLSGDTGAAVIHLYPSDQPTSLAPLDAVAHGTRFAVVGSLAATGTWRADVLVRTAAAPAYRTLPFTFTVGPGAVFILPGLNPATVSLAIAPGLLSAPNTVTIAGVQASAVRLLSQSLDMLMGSIPYDTTPLGGGRWRVSNLFAPMNGRWALTVQARRDGGWITVRRVVYQVPLSGTMRLLTPQARGQGSASVPSAAGSRIAQGANLSAPFNVAFARTLPYTSLVTEMGSNGVRTLAGRLLPTGVQAHGVDVLDGTPYAYITNFGADPGTVSQIDLRSMRVVRTFAVGLGPAHLVFAPDHRRAFVTDFHSGDLFVLDLTSGATRRIAFPGDNCFEPHGLDISEDGRTLFVACAGGAWIYTVDARTLRPKRLVITAPGAFGVAVDAPRHEVWVTNQTANSVTVLDETTLAVRATIPVGKGPALLVPTPDGRIVYVADQLGNTVSVIDAGGRRVVATIPVAAQPHGPDVTADGKYVYVASIGGNAVTIIRTSDNHVVAVVPSAVGSNEVAIAH